MKYVDTQVVFKELPNEITLAINISGCPLSCKGCHSPHLQKDEGIELTSSALRGLIEDNKGITCVAFMGGDPQGVEHLAEIVKSLGLKTAWFTGRTYFPAGTQLDRFDYLKLGPYEEDKGGLDNPNTNQKLFKIEEIKLWK